jgi:hypothetical protein
VTKKEKPTMNKQYYYRPLSFYGGKVLKCAGAGAEKAEHREFYEKHFNTDLDNGKFLSGVVILNGYRGDTITAGDQNE